MTTPSAIQAPLVTVDIPFAQGYSLHAAGSDDRGYCLRFTDTLRGSSSLGYLGIGPTLADAFEDLRRQVPHMLPHQVDDVAHHMTQAETFARFMTGRARE